MNVGKMLKGGSPGTVRTVLQRTARMMHSIDTQMNMMDVPETPRSAAPSRESVQEISANFMQDI